MNKSVLKNDDDFMTWIELHWQEGVLIVIIGLHLMAVRKRCNGMQQRAFGPDVQTYKVLWPIEKNCIIYILLTSLDNRII